MSLKELKAKWLEKLPDKVKLVICAFGVYILVLTIFGLYIKFILLFLTLR